MDGRLEDLVERVEDGIDMAYEALEAIGGIVEEEVGDEDAGRKRVEVIDRFFAGVFRLWERTQELREAVFGKEDDDV